MALKLLPEDLSDVPPHLADRYEAQAGRYWDLFYRRNTTKFFKDRHYLHKEFPALAAGPATLLEVGCGVGNTVFPLLEVNPQLKIYCCDFAASAIDLVRQNPLYDASGGAVHAFVADITADNLAAPTCTGGCGVPENGCDIATMIFVLSAIHPQRMAAAVHNVARCLRPGTGRLLFRDYAEGDLAQERLAGGDRPKRLGANFYVRGDGTRCYYYSQPEVLALFASAGFVCDSMMLHERTVVNHKRDIAMDRRWIQAIFTLRQPQPPQLPLETLLVQPPPQHNQHHNYPPQPWQLPQQQDHQPPPQLPQCAATPAQGASAEAAEAPRSVPGSKDRAEPSTMEIDDPGSPSGVFVDGSGCGDGSSDSGPPPPPPPLPGLMVAGTWLTGAAGRLASHLAAGPGQPSGRALLPDSLDAADDLAAELSPSPNQHQHPLQHQNHPQAHPQHNHHHNQQHQYGQHQHQNHMPSPPSSSSPLAPAPAPSAASPPASFNDPQQHHPHQRQRRRLDCHEQQPPAPSSVAGGGAGASGGGAAGGGGEVVDMEADITGAAIGAGEEEGVGRSLESQLEAEFFATIGRDSAEVVAEEVAATGAALSRVQLADVSEVAAARLAAAAVATTIAASNGGSAHGSRLTSGTQQVPHGHHRNHPPQGGGVQQGRGGRMQGELAATDVSLVVEEAEVEVTAGISFRCLCRVAAAAGGLSVPQLPPATLALARLFLSSPRLMAGKFALQLGPCRSPAAATGSAATSSTATSGTAAAAAAVLPAMAAVRGSARRVVVTEPVREGLAAAAADLRRNAHRLVIERARLTTLDWAAAGVTPHGLSAADAATGAAGYTYVSGAVRQIRDVLQIQPNGYDIVYAADPLAEMTAAAVAAAAADGMAGGTAAGELAIAAARGLFYTAAQLTCPSQHGGGSSSCRTTAVPGPSGSVVPGDRLLLLCVSGSWAAAHGMGLAALAGACGWELLVPEQLSDLYGMDVGTAAVAGCTVMGFRPRAAVAP